MYKPAARRFLIILAAWSAFALFSTLEGRVEAVYSGEWKSWWPIFIHQIEFTTILALLTPLVLRLSRRFRLDTSPYWRNGLIHLVSACVFAVISRGAWLCLLAFTEMPSLFEPKRFMRNLTYMIDYPIVLYVVVVLSGYAIEYYLRFKRGQVRAAELQSQLATAQLNWLKAQLHPHFLFNALHTISSLVREDPTAAERMIARLSDLLRLALRQGTVQLVPLETELQYLNLYLDIEKVRFEDRLTVHFEVAEDTLTALVPSLILQPLVENAIRHGIGQRPGPGEVVIRSTQEGGRLSLSVIDNGAGLHTSPAEPLREGVGLFTVRGRLEHLYGQAQSLILKDLGSGVEVCISIPFEKQPAAQPPMVYETV